MRARHFRISRWSGELGQVAIDSGRVADLLDRLEAMKGLDRESLLPLLGVAEVYQLGNDIPSLSGARRLRAAIRGHGILGRLITAYEEAVFG